MGQGVKIKQTVMSEVPHVRKSTQQEKSRGTGNLAQTALFFHNLCKKVELLRSTIKSGEGGAHGC